MIFLDLHMILILRTIPDTLKERSGATIFIIGKVWFISYAFSQMRILEEAWFTIVF